jgi:hypothetical protein
MQVKISKNSTLVLDGQDIVVDSLNLDGVLIVRATNGSRVVITDLDVKTDTAWKFVELGAAGGAASSSSSSSSSGAAEGKDAGSGAAAAQQQAPPEALRIRGYSLVKPPGAHLEFVFSDGAAHKLDGAALKQAAAAGAGAGAGKQ